GSDFGRNARDDGALHLVQGVQARMPDRDRHGANEDRVSAPLPQTAPTLAARPADRLFAALCALRRARRTIAEYENPYTRARPVGGTDIWPQCRSHIAALVEPSPSRLVYRRWQCCRAADRYL